MRTLNFSILFVYLNFNKFPSSDFRVHWDARDSELGKTNSEILTSEHSGTQHYHRSHNSTDHIISDRRGNGKRQMYYTYSRFSDTSRRLETGHTLAWVNYMQDTCWPYQHHHHHLSSPFATTIVLPLFAMYSRKQLECGPVHNAMAAQPNVC